MKRPTYGDLSMTDTPTARHESTLQERVLRQRKSEGISLRRLGDIIGVAHSALARVDRGEGQYSTETARLLRSWLGDDVSTGEGEAERAEKVGRAIARGATDEILRIVRQTTNAAALDAAQAREDRLRAALLWYQQRGEELAIDGVAWVARKELAHDGGERAAAALEDRT